MIGDDADMARRTARQKMDLGAYGPHWAPTGPLAVLLELAQHPGTSEKVRRACLWARDIHGIVKHHLDIEAKTIERNRAAYWNEVRSHHEAHKIAALREECERRLSDQKDRRLKALMWARRTMRNKKVKR